MSFPQNYPRINDYESRYSGFLDDFKLVQHHFKITQEKLREIISQAIESASKKSSRAILDVAEDISEEDLNVLLLKAGNELFKYFVKYCGDPAASAYDCVGRLYSDIAREQFHNRTLQKERMNSGWRYQFIARDAALESHRFSSLSDIGSAEADFNATIDLLDGTGSITIYVSIKNRVNTMGGQDWPKAIRALETVASGDKNRTGPYICVFGIAMDRGMRIVKREQRTNQLYSVNTEIWLSDYFWPFFSNYSYQEIIHEVVSALGRGGDLALRRGFAEVPDQLINSFGEECKKYGLIDNEGKFNDPHKLADLFVLGTKEFTVKYAE